MKDLLWMDDLNHLTNILNSRVVDLSDVNSEGKKQSMAIKREGKEAVLAHENLTMSRGEKQEVLDGARVETSTPMLPLAMKYVQRTLILQKRSAEHLASILFEVRMAKILRSGPLPTSVDNLWLDICGPRLTCQLGQLSSSTLQFVPFLLLDQMRTTVRNLAAI